MVKRPRLFVTFLAVVALAVGLSPWSTANAASQTGGTVSLSGTGSPTTGDASASTSPPPVSVRVSAARLDPAALTAARRVPADLLSVARAAPPG